MKIVYIDYIDNPWKLRRDQIFTLILIWKQNQLLRKCLDVNIVKMIAEYVKVDVSKPIRILYNNRICLASLVYIFDLFRDRDNYMWKIYGTKYNISYARPCGNCLRIHCHINKTREFIQKNISKLHRKLFEFKSKYILIN